MGRKERRAAIEAIYKSKDTEEWFDKVFTRPVGYVLTLFCNRLNIHPNVVTIISIILGIGAGVCFYFPSLGWTLAGIALLVSANILDSVDGQLARMTGKKSLLGRVLDGFAGDVWFFCIYAAISLRLFNKPMPFLDRNWGIWIFVLAMVLSLFSHMFQANLADYVRNIYTKFRTGSSELSDTRALRQEQRETPSREWFRKIWQFFYIGYVSRQELCTPDFQKMRDRLIPDGPAAGMKPSKEFAQEFCDRTCHLIKWANISTFNTRAIVLYIIMLTGQPWLYLVFEVTVMNILLAYMVSQLESVCRDMTAKYL